jgi:ribosomal protein S18 acetylase RimI-like enzyme
MTAVTLTPDRLDEATAVLCEAFRDYPVMRYVLGWPTDDYDARLRKMIGFFTATRFLNGDVVLGVETADGALGAVANITRPAPEASAEVARRREALWRELGANARTRYEELGRLWQPLGISAPHYHLNMIGSDQRLRGRGAARMLLDALHTMSAMDARSCGASLTTDDPANVTLYQHFGYRLTGEVDVPGAFRTWGFFRADSGV